MINISVENIDNYDLIFNIKDINSFRDELIEKNGIYLFFNDKDECLYVGITSGLFYRLSSYYRGNSNNNNGIVNHIANNHCVIKVIYEDELWKREIVETYLINTLNPMFNIAKKNTVNPTKEIYKIAQEYSSDKGIFSYSALKNFASGLYDRDIVEKCMNSNTFASNAGLYRSDNLFVSREIFIKLTVNSLYDYFSKSNTDIVSIERVAMDTRFITCIVNSSIFRDNLKWHGFKYMKDGKIAKI
jgi:hypothetical protein